jgi:spore germination cell wall hydrolase CwlJ-like protein
MLTKPPPTRRWLSGMEPAFHSKYKETSVIDTLRHIGARWFVVGMIICLLSAGSTIPRYESTKMVTATIAAQKPIQRTAPKPKIYKKPTSSLVCLAQNLYFEARSEPAEALQAVAATVFNRMGNKPWASSVCGVVYQYRQYSWTLNKGNWSRTPPAAYTKLAAQFMKEREWLMDMFPVTHFHRWDIQPKWAPSLNYVATYGQHIFYSSGL